MVHLVNSYLLSKKSCQLKFEEKWIFCVPYLNQFSVLMLKKYQQIINFDDCIRKIEKFRSRIGAVFAYLFIFLCHKNQNFLISRHFLCTSVISFSITLKLSKIIQIWKKIPIPWSESHRNFYMKKDCICIRKLRKWHNS